MPDPRFFAVAGPFTLKQLAEFANADITSAGITSAGITSAGIKGETSPDRVIRNVAPLIEAGPDDISFLDNKAYIDQFSASKAGACVVHPDMVKRAPKSMALLVTTEPYHGYAGVARAFYPEHAAAWGHASTSPIDESAVIGTECTMGPGVVIGPRAEIGSRCNIGANTVIGPGVVVGDDCSIGASATLACCILGHGVIIHSGVRLGQDGFGFALRSKGHIKVPQLGRVLVGDNVEIGANTTIDRGTGPDTVIGDGCKIDNLVQIGHNVELGKNCVVVAQVGISGSTKAGDFVMMGGQAGFAGHLTIGAGAQIAAQSGVMRDIPPGARIGGYPAQPMGDWMRSTVLLERMIKKSRKKSQE